MSLGLKSNIVAISTAVLALGGVAHSAQARQGEGFEFSGDCVVGLFFVPGDADAVQTYLPQGYTVLADPLTRTATLIVEAGSCSNAIVDGDPVGSYGFGEILVLIGPPGDPIGNVYDFGAPISNPLVAKRWDSLGLGPLHLLTRDLSVRAADDGSSVEADVPWSFSPYSFSIQLSGQPFDQPDPNNRCCAWTEGSRGTVGGRFCLSHDGEAGEIDTAGRGTIKAEPGTPLAQMMGSETFTGPAFRREFHFQANASLFASRADAGSSPSACRA